MPEVNLEMLWAQLVAKAWDDPALMQKLLSDPSGVLKENGLLVPAGVQLKAVQNTDKVVHLVIPKKPTPSELSEAELHRVAGSRRHGSHSSRASHASHRCRCQRCACNCACGCEACMDGDPVDPN